MASPSEVVILLKALKIWDGLLLAAAIILYLIGIISGEFSDFNGLLFSGDSLTAVVLMTSSVFCLILSVSLFLVIRAIRKR